MVADNVELDVDEVVRESDDALLCKFATGEQEWIPKSQIDDDSEVYKAGTDGVLVIPEWLALEKSLI